MMYLLIKLLFLAFFINLLYELLHSVLYKTCHEVNLKRYIYLILKGAIFDGFSITIIYFITYIIFENQNPFDKSAQIISFLLMNLILAYFWDLYAIKNKRWEYSEKMPLVLGVGITPLIQLALTGLLTLYFIFYFF